MGRNTARTLGMVVLMAVWTPFLACNLLQIGDPNEPPDDPSPFAVFDDPDSDFSTSDVRDVDDEIVRFDASAKTIVWAADDTAFQEGVWEVNGVFLAGGAFQVRFGTQDGERRAYFTETGNGFICQIESQGASISISGTSVPVPQE